jgi:3-deoxy-D-manno-octulosonate 8-phosphate phosphatase (KDO 8-P phosphatase)
MDNKNIVVCLTAKPDYSLDLSSPPYIFTILQTFSCINQIYIYCSYDQIKNYMCMPCGVKYLENFSKMSDDYLSNVKIYQKFGEQIEGDVYFFIELSVSPSILTSNVILQGLNSIIFSDIDISFTVSQKQDLSSEIILVKTDGFNIYKKTALKLNDSDKLTLTYAPVILNKIEIIPKSIMMSYQSRTENIKMIIFDFDGCFSDGVINLDYKGRAIKNYYTLDADAVVKTINKNYKIGIISGNCLKFFKKKAKQWGLAFLHGNIKSKLETVISICNKTGIEITNVAFFGDGLNDITVLKAVGFSGCPNNAHPDVKKIVDYISPLNGGKGAITDFLSMF